MWRRVCLILIALGVVGTVAVAESTERFARFQVKGWDIVGVWQQNYGIDVQMVIERSGDAYRIRWVSSDDPKSQDSTAPVARSGKTFKRTGSSTGDYYEVLPTGEIACYDNEGFIENLKPVR